MAGDEHKRGGWWHHCHIPGVGGTQGVPQSVFVRFGIRITWKQQCPAELGLCWPSGWWLWLAQLGGAAGSPPSQRDWSTGVLLHPGDSWDGICSFLDHAQVLSPHLVLWRQHLNLATNREQRGQVVSGAQDELQTSLMEMCCSASPLLGSCLFVKPLDVILHCVPGFLLQQISWEKCPHCSVTKHVLEMEKAPFKENMTFQWKKYLCMLFLILKLCLGMLPWTLKSELALMLSRFYPPFLYNFKLLPLLTRQFCLGGFCTDCFQSTVSLIPSLFFCVFFPPALDYKYL